MKRFFVLLPILALSSCFAEYTAPSSASDKVLRELASAIDSSDSVLFARILKKYPLDTLTEAQRQRLSKIAQKTVALRKRSTGSLFSSGKDTVQAAIAAVLTVCGGKLVYTSITRDQDSTFERVVKGLFGSLLTCVSFERFTDNLNLFQAHKSLDRARAIVARLESSADTDR